MLLQTNSYVVPRDKRMEHARILRRFRQTLLRLGCDHFEVYEQVGPNWAPGETSGRYVQIMRFRDRKHQLAVQAAERSDPTAQALLREFCELINLPYQQQQGLFAVGFYTSFLRMPSAQPAYEQGGNELAVHPPEHGEEQPQTEGHEASNEAAPAEGTPAQETSSAEEAVAAAVETPAEETSAESEPENQPGPEASQAPPMEKITPVMTEPVASEAPAPEMEASNPSEPEEAPLADIERISHESTAPADTNEDELNAEARNEQPIDSEGIDSESVFLGAMDGDLDEPGSVRPLALDDDAEADTEKPAHPSK
jgi:hypothetical protein